MTTLEAADWVLYPAWFMCGYVLVAYGLLQPWWRSLFGWTAVLALFALFQMMTRALLVQMFGESYDGRDLLLLTGRLEILVSMTAMATGLTIFLKRRYLSHSQPTGEPDAVSVDQDPR